MLFLQPHLWKKSVRAYVSLFLRPTFENTTYLVRLSVYQKSLQAIMVPDQSDGLDSKLAVGHVQNLVKWNI